MIMKRNVMALALACLASATCLSPALAGGINGSHITVRASAA